MHTKKKIAVFDIDGTIFRSALHFELFHGLVHYGIFPNIVVKEIEQYHDDWINRRGAYKDYEMSLITSYSNRIKGKVVEDVENVSRFVLEQKSGYVYVYTRDLIESLREEYLLVAISGAPQEILTQFAQHLKFDYAYGAIYEQIEGKYTGNISFPAYFKKAEILNNFCTEHNLTLDGSLGIGDTIGDVAFLELVEQPIAFNPSQELYAVAKERGWKTIVERKDVIYEI